MRCWTGCARALALAGLGVLAGCDEPPVAPQVPTRLVLTASDTIRAAGGTVTFTAVAVDSQGTPVPDVPIVWTVANRARGKISPEGVFTAGPEAGRTYVRANVQSTDVRDSLPVQVMAPGTVRWTWAASEVGGTMPVLGGPVLGPDGTVYVQVTNGGFPDFPGTLVALTPAATVRWAVPLLKVSGSTGPVVVPGSGLIWVVGSNEYLISPEGTIVWDSVPQAVNPDFKSGAATDQLLVAAVGLHVLVHDAATQALLWESQEATLSDWLVPPTLTADGKLLAKHTEDTLFAFTAADGQLLRFYEDPDSGVDQRMFGRGVVPVADRYYLPMRSLFAAMDTTGPVLWLAGDVENGVSEPIVSPDGTLFVMTSRRGLWAVKPDGTTLWTRGEILPRWPWWFGGVALAAGGLLYAPSIDGLWAMNRDGQTLWRFVADTTRGPDGFPVGAFVGAPAVAPDGTVYTFTSTHLYAFWASAPPEPNSPWPMWRHDAQRTGWAR
jgi:hypothetical protein